MILYLLKLMASSSNGVAVKEKWSRRRSWISSFCYLYIADNQSSCSLPELRAGGALGRRMAHRRSPRLFLFCSRDHGFNCLNGESCKVFGKCSQSSAFTWSRTSRRLHVICVAPGFISCFAWKIGFLQFGSRNNAGNWLCLNTPWTLHLQSK